MPSTPPFRHALKVFEAMEKEANDENIEGVEVLVYRGKVTYLYQSLGLSQTYYSPIFRNLKDMGCITMLGRGNLSEGSAYVVHHAPVKDEWERISSRPLTRPVDVAILSQRLGDIERQLGGIDIGEALAELATRLTRVERKINNGKK